VVGKNLLSGNGVLPLQSLSGQLQNPYPPGSALYAQQQVFVDRFNADPELRARFAGTFSSKGLYAELTRALQRGARSLDSKQLLSLTKAMAAVIPRLPQHSCAKLIRPRDDFDPELGADFRAALERLPPHHHRNFWEFYLQALKAEIQQLPEIPVDMAARERALLDLGSRYPGQFGQRISAVFANPSGAADEDACWAMNTITHTSTQLSPDHAEQMARLLWGGE
jgi:hypothetical protein